MAVVETRNLHAQRVIKRHHKFLTVFFDFLRNYDSLDLVQSSFTAFFFTKFVLALLNFPWLQVSSEDVFAKTFTFGGFRSVGDVVRQL